MDSIREWSWGDPNGITITKPKDEQRYMVYDCWGSSKELLYVCWSIAGAIEWIEEHGYEW